MTLKLDDRIQETSVTSGTGTLTLDGAVVSFRPFSTLGDGNTTYYAIVGAVDWEVGQGTYTAGTLSRDTVFSSSNSNNLVNFTAETKSVFVDYPASIAAAASGSGVASFNTRTGAVTLLDTDVTGALGATAVTNAVNATNAGNATTVTNGVYTTGSYANPTWITGLDYSKLSGTVPTWNQNTTGNAATVTNGVYTTGSYANPTWITSFDYSKLTGTVPTWNQNTTGNAATATTANSATTATTATYIAAGTATQIPYQTSPGVTSFIAAPTVASFLQWNGTSFGWANPTGAGTVTSVGGTGTVSGISLSGTVTSSGNLTLGGSLDLSSPPAIGGTTPAAVTATNLKLTGGSYAEGVYSGTYVDGIVVDYDIASAVGRISVGGADGLNFYNGGVAGSLLGAVTNNGDWSLARFLDVGNGTLIGGATNPIIAAAGSANQYVQNYIHNDNSGTSASADFAAYPDNGSDASGWLDFGITSSTYSDVAYPITGANEGYVFMSAPSGAGKTGNLVYATDSTGSQNYHQWYVGGFGVAKSAWEMQLTSSGLALANALSVGNGGTGATTAGAALTNLGAQAALVSGTNIKTVNSTSLLGSGDVAVQPTLVSATNIKTINGASILGSGDLTVSSSFTGGTLTSALVLAAGTTSLAPLNFQLGTNLTTAAAGSMEYDGTVPYFSIAASTRGAIPTEQWVVLTGTNTLTSQTAVQPIFDGGGGPTNGSVTLPVGTYQFECDFALTGMSATSGSFGFGLGGTATKTFSYHSTSAKAGTALTTSMATLQLFATAANTALQTASTGTVGTALIKGIIRVTVAGTVIPQVSLTVASAAVIQAGSYFRISPIGNATVATVGNWS